jgi:hypothetical protein
MGSIIERPRRDGTIAYLAKIAIMREGVVVLRESRTFDRKPAAKTWIEEREKELAILGALDRATLDQNDPPCRPRSTAISMNPKRSWARPRPRFSGPSRPTTSRPRNAPQSAPRACAISPSP